MSAARKLDLDAPIGFKLGPAALSLVTVGRPGAAALHQATVGATKADTQDGAVPIRKATDREWLEARARAVRVAQGVSSSIDHDVVADRAVDKACKTWRGKGPFSAFVAKIAGRLATREAAKEAAHCKALASGAAAGSMSEAQDFYAHEADDRAGDVAEELRALTEAGAAADVEHVTERLAIVAPEAKRRERGRPKAARLHTREELVEHFKAEWTKATGRARVPRCPPAAASLERQRLAVVAVAKAWKKLLAVFTSPDGLTMAPDDGVMRNTIDKAAVHMSAFSWWTDEIPREGGSVQVSRRSLVAAFVGKDAPTKGAPKAKTSRTKATGAELATTAAPAPKGAPTASPRTCAILCLLWWDIASIPDEELRVGIAPGLLLQQTIRRLT